MHTKWQRWGWMMVGLWLPSAWAEARPGYLSILPPKAQRCTTCHFSQAGGARNPFGSDFEKTGSLTLIGDRDSDGDGVINRVELEEGTNPGDPKSYPGANPFRMWIWVSAIAGGIMGSAGFLVFYKRKRGVFS